MTLRERLLNGEKVAVQGKYTAKRFYIRRVEGSLGVFFLQAYEMDGKRVKNESVRWNHPTCEAWIRGVRIATAA